MSHSIITYIFLAAFMAGGAGYIQGYRFIGLEEIPASKRPTDLFLMADYSTVADIFGEQPVKFHRIASAK